MKSIYSKPVFRENIMRLECGFAASVSGTQDDYTDGGTYTW